MTVTVLKLSDADAYLKNISIRSIKDVRALDVDLMLVLVNGDRIIISSGAVSAMSAPESSLQFADGQLPLASVFQQIDKIDVSPEANLTVSSKEITRYNQNNARNKKARKNDEEDSDKPVVVEDGERDPSAAAETSGSSGNTERPNFSPTRSPDNQSQIADAEINSQHEKNWGVQWPIAAGALALLAAAGGGGGGGGSGGGNGGSAANGGSGGAGSGAGAAAAGSAGAGTVDPSAAVIRGNAALGAIKNANVTAYDAAGNAISDTVPDKLASLLDLIQSLMNTVAGTPATPPLSQDTLRQLGVNLDGLIVDSTGKLVNWPAIRAAIAGSKADGSEVDSLTKLNALVEKADASQETLRNYAVTNAGTPPTQADYKNVGLVRFPTPPAAADGPRPALVGAEHVEAINAALRTTNACAPSA